MKADWREVPRDGVRAQWAAMYVTLNPRGEIYMSGRTWEQMGGPRGFVVLYDKGNKRLGLRPAAESTRNSYRCLRKGRNGGKKLMCYRLITEFRIELTETLQFIDPQRKDDDNLLILDLRTAKVSARAVGWKKRKGD